MKLLNRCTKYIISVCALSAALLLCHAPAALAQETLEFQKDVKTGLAVAAEFVPAGQPAGRLRFNAGIPAQAPAAADPHAAADIFISRYAAQFGGGASGVTLKIIAVTEDDNGTTHAIYGQNYKNYPVLGGEINVNVSQAKVTGAVGRLAAVTPFTPVRRIGETQARQVASVAWAKRYPKVAPTSTVSGPFVYVPSQFRPGASSRPSLVWSVRSVSNDPPIDYRYLVDALTGAVALEASGERQIDRRVGDCTIMSQTGRCGNYDTWNAAHTYRYGRREGYTPAGTNPTYGGTDVDDSFEMLVPLDTFLAAKFNRYGLNGQGGSGNGTNIPVGSYRIFNYLEGVSASNGPFCGTFQYSTIQLCAGAAIPDIIGHEGFHGLMLYTYNGDQSIGAGLNYYGQSGAIEEAGADIFGASFEEYVKGATDFKAQKHRDPAYGYHRDSANPHALSNVYGVYPDRVGDAGYYCGSGDQGGVHHNSTVLSHAIYYMAKGGTFNGTRINGIGFDRAAPLTVKALTSFAITSPSFATAVASFTQACAALYPGITAEDICNQVRVALLAAEMDKSPVCGTGTPLYTSTVSCSDTDGENIYTAGTVRADGYEFKDRCVGNILTEQTCAGTDRTRMSKAKVCLKGCKDGYSCRP